MVDKTIGDWTLSGRIDGVHQNGLACYRPALLQPKDMLRIWILHLILNCTRPSSSILIGKELMQMYQPVENSSALLEELLGLYWRGLREPLRFFPRSSHAFAKATIERDVRKDPQTQADIEWKDEQSDSYIQLAFRNVPEPRDIQWRELASKVFAPLIKNRTETKL
jgi:exodeoxyribonuclease V gamma subunit